MTTPGPLAYVEASGGVRVADELSLFDPLNTYSAVALDYDYASQRYWAWVPERAIEMAELGPGMQVLDAGCNTGAATLAAAQRVGARGRVVAVDFSPAMLALATEKASRRSVLNIDWRMEDLITMPLPPARFDAVLCLLVVFHMPDMPALVASLWRAMRPGGRLVLATFGQQFFVPLGELFISAVSEERADFKPPRPWTRTQTTDQLRSVLNEANVPNADVFEETKTVELPEPGDWWRIVRGTGLGRTLELLGPESAARIEAANLRAITQDGIGAVTTSILYAVARKP